MTPEGWGPSWQEARRAGSRSGELRTCLQPQAQSQESKAVKDEAI